MEEEPVHVIRESTRALLMLNRQQYRGAVRDVNRSVCNFRVTPEIVSNIAQKLKSKISITASDLQMLKNGLMDDPNNKTIVLNTHGALRGLVRELTGHEVRKQCAAAGCLCNLALGESRACNTIAKASGSYLVVALDNLTIELAVTCAWTLGNLAGSSSTVCELLVSQGALAKLCDMLQGSDEQQDAALYALVHFANQLRNELGVDNLSRILQGLRRLQPTMSSSRLLFILSCHRDYQEHFTEDLIRITIEDFIKAIDTHVCMCQSNVHGDNLCCKLVYLIRILANTNVSKIYDILLEHLIASNVSEHLSKIFISDNKYVRDSLLWLLGNLYNHNNNNKLFYSLLNL